MVWRMCQKRLWFDVEYHFFSFFFSFSPKIVPPTRNIIATSSISFFFTFGLYPLDYYFFNFRINYKITNSFQLHSLLFLNLYIIYQIIFFLILPQVFLNIWVIYKITNIFLISPSYFSIYLFEIIFFKFFYTNFILLRFFFSIKIYLHCFYCFFSSESFFFDIFFMISSFRRFFRVCLVPPPLF